MWRSIKRELNYLKTHQWDLTLVTWVPLFLIVLFAGMFYSGKAEHLPIAIIDQDHSTLSQHIIRYVDANTTLDVAYQGIQLDDVESLLNQNKVWGYIHIPEGAESRFAQSQDAQISIAYNQSFYSIGNTISTAMQLSALRGLAEFGQDDYLASLIPSVDSPLPHLKISTLYNPNLNYEFYLEAFMVPAILHLLLCCCVAFAVGQEFKYNTQYDWLKQGSVISNLMAKIMVYVLIFCAWTWLWLIWMTQIRGWFIAGSLSVLLIGQFLMFLAYALISASLVFATRDLNKTFGLIAVYGGSSLSFSGMTLPLNNAPIFTQFWSSIIPYTPYAKLQTQQWVIGSPLMTSVIPLGLLLVYVLLYGFFTILLVQKVMKKGENLA